jgi:hypothetical protein
MSMMQVSVPQPCIKFIHIKNTIDDAVAGQRLRVSHDLSETGFSTLRYCKGYKKPNSSFYAKAKKFIYTGGFLKVVHR